MRGTHIDLELIHHVQKLWDVRSHGGTHEVSRCLGKHVQSSAVWDTGRRFGGTCRLHTLPWRQTHQITPKRWYQLRSTITHIPQASSKNTQTSLKQFTENPSFHGVLLPSSNKMNRTNVGRLYIYTYTHIYIHTYTHTYIHTYTHTHIHT